MKCHHGRVVVITFLCAGLTHQAREVAPPPAVSRPDGDSEEVRPVMSDYVSESGIKLRLRNRTWNYEVRSFGQVHLLTRMIFQSSHDAEDVS